MSNKPPNSPISLLSDIITVFPTIAHFLSDKITVHVGSLGFLGSSYFLSISIVFILVILHFRNYSVNLNYRLWDDPSALNLKMNTLKRECGDSITLYYLFENSGGVGCKMLSYLWFKLFIVIEYPNGIKLTPERKYLEFDREERARELVLIGNITDPGRREIKLDVQLDPDANFGGEYPISVKIYIGPRQKRIRNVSSAFVGMLGFNKINILPEK